ncbi:hypothetical protein QYE76_032438 [Lolium multiflorum]|uniref:DUF4216 domain-containing protein n=1 Tax=Lolium multiflorum TaxID=4521 RepID=A0AAD8VL60_LOLMU|nr:hypothetical protein QYE76_032438 [Lolium multiflorum]
MSFSRKNILAANGFGRGSLTVAEAWALYRARYPVPPGVRLPSNGGWRMPVNGIGVPLLLLGTDRWRDAIRTQCARLSAEERADPTCTPTGNDDCEFRQELGGRGVRDTEETVQREFAGWFANHVRQLDNASEDLKSLAAGPDRRVVVYAGCNVKGARFRTLTRDKDLKTQNSGVATKGSFGDADETEYYGVLQEVLELQYGSNKHGDRSVYLFRCDWFDLASRGSKIKDDGYFKSVNTSVLWFKNSPFILASQAETCFYLEDTKFGDPWKVVQKFSHRHVYDVPELEDGNDDAFVRNEDAYQEDEGSVDHTFHDVVDLDEEAEVEAEEDDHRADEVVRIHDARTIRELENGEDSPNVDMDMSEDELQNEEESLIMEENIHDDEGKNSEEDSDVD